MADGLKQNDLEKCCLCDKGLMHNGDPVCYRISMQQFVFDTRAIQEMTGMEMMMGEAAPLAQIMGPNRDMAKAASAPMTGLLCAPCAMESTAPLFIWGAIAEKAEKAGG